MTRHNTTAFSAVRISPDGESLAWYRPDSDAQPWLVITEDPTALGVEHDWAGDVDVADWTDLQDPDAVRADDALLTEVVDVIAVADPVPAGLARRVLTRISRLADWIHAGRDHCMVCGRWSRVTTLPYELVGAGYQPESGLSVVCGACSAVTR